MQKVHIPSTSASRCTSFSSFWFLWTKTVRLFFVSLCELEHELNSLDRDDCYKKKSKPTIQQISIGTCIMLMLTRKHVSQILNIAVDQYKTKPVYKCENTVLLSCGYMEKYVSCFCQTRLLENGFMLTSYFVMLCMCAFFLSCLSLTPRYLQVYLAYLGDQLKVVMLLKP